MPNMIRYWRPVILPRNPLPPDLEEAGYSQADASELARDMTARLSPSIHRRREDAIDRAAWAATSPLVYPSAHVVYVPRS